MKNNDVTIVVNTCDAYNDVWELFFCAFNEYWDDCEYDIVINTESKIYDNNNDIITHTFQHKPGQDLWGLRLQETLKSIKTPFVIMLYDDFILEGKVNTQEINKIVEWMKADDKICVFYWCNLSSGTDLPCKYPDYQVVSTNGDYRLNSVPAVWRKDKLLEFTGKNDSPWAWEYFGSYRTYNKDNLFYCRRKDKENIFIYNRSMGGAIYRGKWVGQVVLPLIEKYNLDLDVTIRGLADGINEPIKRSLKWKIDFILLGFKMIGIGVFFYIGRIFTKKIKGLF